MNITVFINCIAVSIVIFLTVRFWWICRKRIDLDAAEFIYTLQMMANGESPVDFSDAKSDLRVLFRFWDWTDSQWYTRTMWEALEPFTHECFLQIAVLEDGVPNPNRIVPVGSDDIVDRVVRKLHAGESYDDAIAAVREELRNGKENKEYKTQNSTTETENE